MAVGKAACRKARPTSAGLKRFCPSPPQISLPSPMPTTPPRKAIHSGNAGGSVRPSSTPVVSALSSRSRLGLSERLNSHSVPAAPAVAAAATSSAPIPKFQQAASSTRSAAPSTSNMMRGVVAPSRTKGAVDRTRSGDPVLTQVSSGSVTAYGLRGALGS